MTLILSRPVTRRRFLEMTGASVGMASCASQVCSAEDTRRFQPCLDRPFRSAPNDPNYPTPVEAALDVGGTPLANVPRMPQGRVSAPGVIQFAPRGSSEAARAPARMAALNRWKVPVLNVAFESNPALATKVLKIVKDVWEPLTGIPFRASSSARAEIRVGFQVQNNRPDSGHWSYVGIESLPDNVPGKSMNLAISEHSLDHEPYDRAVVLHEFGHALGCIHEHLSPGSGGIQFNERRTIQYFQSRYGWSEAQTRLNVLNKYSERSVLRFTAFDSDSIMLYQYDGSITENGVGTKQNYELSATDKSFISQLYGVTKVGEGQTEPNTKPTTTQPQTTAKTPSRAITLDGDALGGKLIAGDDAHEYTFELTAGHTCRIETFGYTQIDLQLYREQTPVSIKAYTPDLVNLQVTQPFDAGKYRLVIKHRYKDGAGEYGVRLKSP